MFPFATVLLANSGSAVVLPSFRASSIQYANNTSTSVFPFPTGSVSGDTCVVFAGNGWNVNTPSGWTSLDNLVGTNVNGAVFYKTLTSGDITTGSVTITYAGTYYGIVAGFTLIGAPTSFRTPATQRNSTGATSHTLTTDTTPVSYDIAIYFGMARVATSPTVSVGAQLQQSNNANASGVLAWRKLTASGADSATFSYPSAGSGDYQAIVIVHP